MYEVHSQLPRSSVLQNDTAALFYVRETWATAGLDILGDGWLFVGGASIERPRDLLKATGTKKKSTEEATPGTTTTTNTTTTKAPRIPSRNKKVKQPLILASSWSCLRPHEESTVLHDVATDCHVFPTRLAPNGTSRSGSSRRILPFGEGPRPFTDPVQNVQDDTALRPSSHRLRGHGA